MLKLETKRLLIRPFVMADLEAAHQLLDHDLHWAGPNISLEQRRERLQHEISLAYMDDLLGYRAVVLKTTEAIIGICGFLLIVRPPQEQRLFWPLLFNQREKPPTKFTTLELEIGYAIASQQQRQGYANEAVHALFDYAFGELKIERIFASTNRKNAGSIALMKHVGMRVASNPERLDEDWPDAPGVMGVIENYLT